MGNPYEEYLKLLREVGDSLKHLTELAEQERKAVRQNDLITMDEVLKQEQAMTLTLRGQEQKRMQLLAQLGMSQVPLSGLETHYPPGLRPQAKQTAQELRDCYQAFHSAWEQTRETLEHNLHEVEGTIMSLGGDPTGGTGYSNPNVEPPKNMRTDFRA